MPPSSHLDLQTFFQEGYRPALDQILRISFTRGATGCDSEAYAGEISGLREASRHGIEVTVSDSPSSNSGGNSMPIYYLLLAMRITLSLHLPQAWLMVFATQLCSLLRKVNKRGSVWATISQNLLKHVHRAGERVCGDRNHPQGGKPLFSESRIDAMCELDEAYLMMYFYLISHGGRRLVPGVLAPPSHFELLASLHCPAKGGGSKRDTQKTLESNVNTIIGGRIRGFLAEAARLKEKSRIVKDSARANNPLLRVWAARMEETSHVFSSTTNFLRKVPEKVCADWVGQGSPPKCWRILEKWRDVRDWIARIYAFAVPTREAIAAILDLAAHEGALPKQNSDGGKIVEIGAGTGYWSWLLREAAVQNRTKANGKRRPRPEVVALDVKPTSALPKAKAKRKKGKFKKRAAGQYNEYHGNVPAFTHVDAGDAGSLRRLHAPSRSPQVLFLCYPPPDSDMAEEALQNFQGSDIVYVGEFQGTTGTLRFEHALLRSFILKRTLPLPNFGNTAYQMTCWHRKGKASIDGDHKEGGLAHSGITCSNCAAPLGAKSAPMRRCAFTRMVCACSLACGDSNRLRAEWISHLRARGLLSVAAKIRAGKINLYRQFSSELKWRWRGVETGASRATPDGSSSADPPTTASAKALNTPKNLTRPLHETTAELPIGVGKEAAAQPGKSSCNRLSTIWNPEVKCASSMSERFLTSHIHCRPSGALEECTRVSCVWNLRKRLKKLCTTIGGSAPPIMAFDRWISRGMLRNSLNIRKQLQRLSKKTENAAKRNGESSSPSKIDGIREYLIPSERFEDLGLVGDLTRAGIPSEKAVRIVRCLSKEAVAACKAIRKCAKKQDARGDAGGVTIRRHKHTVDVVSRHRPKLLLKLGIPHYNKLASLFKRFGGSAIKAAGSSENSANTSSSTPRSPTQKARFEESLFRLLARYHALSGHGFQAALNETAFEVLRKHLSVNFECFASPLNAYFPRFCSAFPDTDVPFGSLGSFFTLPEDGSVEGSFEANPPFISEVMTAMADKMHRMLAKAESSSRRLSFVVIVPGWTDEPSWKKMSSSSFLSKKLLVARDDHGFCDGAQHQRRDRYRESPYDTAIFVLQTTSAREAWSFTDDAERDLRAAMAEAHPTPGAKLRRKLEGRGLADADGGGGVYKGKKRNRDPKAGVEARRRVEKRKGKNKRSKRQKLRKKIEK